tara:strand:+ start:3038 stop:3223 length:186 start_codon:yes stop_codon:yes gene_type:complete
MKAYEWFKVVIYLFLWIFTWTLADKLTKKYELSDDTIIKICIIGIFFIVLCIQMNKDINIS